MLQKQSGKSMAQSKWITSLSDNERMAISHINQKYPQLSPAAKSAMMATIKHECGFDLNRKGDNGTAHGACQWRGDRYKNLTNYLSATGRGFGDIRGHIDFAMHEMGINKDHQGLAGFGAESEAGNKLATARTPEQANGAMAAFERYAGWDGGAERQSRLNSTMAYGGAMNGATYASGPASPSPFNA